MNFGKKMKCRNKAWQKWAIKISRLLLSLTLAVGGVLADGFSGATPTLLAMATLRHLWSAPTIRASGHLAKAKQTRQLERGRSGIGLGFPTHGRCPKTSGSRLSEICGILCLTLARPIHE